MMELTGRIAKVMGSTIQNLINALVLIVLIVLWSLAIMEKIDQRADEIKALIQSQK